MRLLNQMNQAKPAEIYKSVGDFANQISTKYGLQVAPKLLLGKSSSAIQGQREFRLQLVNTHQPIAASAIQNLMNDIKSSSSTSNVIFNDLSPNSSKFPSISFTYSGISFDFVIARGANKGENFEKKVVSDLESFFRKASSDASYEKLVGKLMAANKDFAKNEIVKVKQRSGSTKKEGVAIEKLGAIIGDIELTDSTSQKWYISLKDSNGATFSSYSGAASLFNPAGELQPASAGADFLKAFGVDLNKVQEGFDLRLGKAQLRKSFPLSKSNSSEIKSIFERAWGMNYFYVRKESGGWKVFWLDRSKLNEMTQSLKVSRIDYPNKNSKQITVFCSNGTWKYKIEVRNSKGGIYPNDTKFQVL